MKRLLKIIFGLLVLSFGIGLGIALFYVFSGRISMTGDMAFGVLVSLIGCPVMICIGINFIINKNATLG